MTTMQITRPNHESGLGIYAKSLPVKPKNKEVHATALEMCQWMDETNGSFKGEFSRAFAMAHAQVVEHDHPYQLFVVAKELIAPDKIDPKSKQTLTNGYFEAQAIFNCEILEAPEKITRKVPERKVTTDPNDKGKVSVSVELVDKEVDNNIKVPEGCMSFPHRSERNVDRKYRIKVRYQYLKKGLLGERVKTFEGWVEGLKAHIIQHETDHFNGVVIHFKNK